MADAKKFCTCRDTKCPLHPINHDKGCDLCILKNLKQREIPSCFFNKLKCAGSPDSHGYTFAEFAKIVMKEKSE